MATTEKRLKCCKFSKEVIPASAKRFTIRYTPNEAEVEVNGVTPYRPKYYSYGDYEEYTAYFDEGTTVEWRVKCDGYYGQSGEVTIDDDTEIEVKLEPNYIRFFEIWMPGDWEKGIVRIHQDTMDEITLDMDDEGWNQLKNILLKDRDIELCFDIPGLRIFCITVDKTGEDYIEVHVNDYVDDNYGGWDNLKEYTTVFVHSSEHCDQEDRPNNVQTCVMTYRGFVGVEEYNENINFVFNTNTGPYWFNAAVPFCAYVEIKVTALGMIDSETEFDTARLDDISYFVSYQPDTVKVEETVNVPATLTSWFWGSGWCESCLTEVRENTTSSSDDISRGFEYKWAAEAEGYESQSGTVICTEDTNYINIELQPLSYKFTINPDPEDAVVYINGVETKEAEIGYGQEVKWSVEKEGYITQEGVYESLSKDTELDVKLEVITYKVQFELNGRPDSWQIVWTAESAYTGDYRRGSGNITELTVEYGSVLTYEVTATGYETISGATGEIFEDMTLTFDMVKETHTFTIDPTPDDSLVSINGETTRSVTVEYGDTVEYEVSHEGYYTKTGSYTVESDITLSVELEAVMCTLTITATPEAARIEINGQETASVTEPWGTDISWTVSCDGYITQTGNLVLTEDTSLNIDLAEDLVAFTIDPTPDDAIVIINGEETLSAQVRRGASVEWSVSKEGYISKTGSQTVESDTTLSVSLEEDLVSFTITATPEAARIEINGQETASVTVTRNTAVDWVVSCDYYITQTGSQTVTEDTELTVDLQPDMATLTVECSPSDATVTINGVAGSTIELQKGSAYTWTAEREGYESQSGEGVLYEDTVITATLTVIRFTVTINCTPENAVLYYNWSSSVTGGGQGGGGVMSTINVDYGAKLYWELALSGYITQEGTIENITENISFEVVLIKEYSDFTINPTPEDATVIINGTETRSATVNTGSDVEWSVSKEGYITESGTTTVSGDTVIDVELKEDLVSFTINPDPTDATVIINDEETRSVTVRRNTIVEYRVERQYCESVNENYEVTEDTVLGVTMDWLQCDFSLTFTPENANYTIRTTGATGLQGEYTGLGSPVSLTLNQGTTLTYEITADDYETATGEVFLGSESAEEHVDLVPLEYHTFIITPEPDDAIVQMNGEITTQVTVPHNTIVSWNVSKDGYIPQSGDMVVDGDIQLRVTLEPDDPGPYSLKIEPDPDDATVIIDGVETREAEVSPGQTVDYEVLKEGYLVSKGSLTVTGNMTLPVTLATGFNMYNWTAANYVSRSGEQVSDITSFSAGYTPNTAELTAVTNAANAFVNCRNLASLAGFEGLTAGGYNTNFSRCFRYVRNLSDWSECSTWNTDYAGNMSAMFEYCNYMTNCDALAEWNTSNVTKMDWMFQSCGNLKDISGLANWDTGKVTQMQDIFYSCRNLTNGGAVAGWNTGNVTNMSFMFFNCFNITTVGDLSGWDTSNVTSMFGMFSGDSKLSDIGGFEGWDTGNVTNMAEMFTGCSNISDFNGMSAWNTGNVTSMYSMFANCRNMTSVEQFSEWDTSKVTLTYAMFTNCKNIASMESLANWDTGNVTNMYAMFEGCDNLTSAEFLNKWNTNNVTDMVGMFIDCDELQGDIRIRGRNIRDVEQFLFGSTKYIKNIIVYQGSNTYNAFYTAMENSTYCAAWNAYLKVM